MSYTRHILFSFLCISTISFAMEQSHQRHTHHKRTGLKSTFTPQNTTSQQQHTNSTTPPSSQSIKFSESAIQEMELVFKYAPMEAQCIVTHLQDPTYLPLNEDYRAAFFVGEPGSGKTTTAKAIAYFMSKHGWNHQFLSSSYFLGKYRNHTAIRLREELDTIKTSNQPTLLIIDELNKLLENHNSKKHDTDTTATTLWTFLDQQENNTNFFLIGTMNNIKKLPKPLKDRILLDYIVFPLITDPKIQSKILRDSLTTKRTQLDENITDKYLEKTLKQLDQCAGRNIKKIAGKICRVNRLEQPMQSPIMIIQKASIEKVIAEYVYRKHEIGYHDNEEDSEEKQERRHQECLAINKESLQLQHKNIEIQQNHFEQQQKTQEKLHKDQISEQRKHHLASMQMQQTHFIHQQKVQADLSKRQYSASINIPCLGSFNVNNLTQNGSNTLDSIITEEEKKLSTISMKSDSRPSLEESLSNNFCPCGCDYNDYLTQKYAL